MLKPFGYTVSNFKIKKFSLLISHWVKCGDVHQTISDGKLCMLIEIVTFLFKMFASHYCVDFFHIFSMISLMLKLVSAFPTYCLLHKKHSIKYTT